MSWMGFYVQDALTSGGGFGFFVTETSVSLASKDTVASVTNYVSPLLHQTSGAVMQL